MDLNEILQRILKYATKNAHAKGIDIPFDITTCLGFDASQNRWCLCAFDSDGHRHIILRNGATNVLGIEFNNYIAAIDRRFRVKSLIDDSKFKHNASAYDALYIPLNGNTHLNEKAIEMVIMFLCKHRNYVCIDIENDARSEEEKKNNDLKLKMYNDHIVSVSNYPLGKTDPGYINSAKQYLNRVKKMNEDFMNKFTKIIDVCPCASSFEELTMMLDLLDVE